MTGDHHPRVPRATERSTQPHHARLSATLSESCSQADGAVHCAEEVGSAGLESDVPAMSAHLYQGKLQHVQGGWPNAGTTGNWPGGHMRVHGPALTGHTHKLDRVQSSPRACTRSCTMTTTLGLQPAISCAFRLTLGTSICRSLVCVALE